MSTVSDLDKAILNGSEKDALDIVENAQPMELPEIIDTAKKRTGPISAKVIGRAQSRQKEESMKKKFIEAKSAEKIDAVIRSNQEKIEAKEKAPTPKGP
ncbi:hypothetical protein [Delftia lacustris]|uniref:Uncharacterized protein n=1 Tax=Delftia lacustris TaxID=558537 RepID=A0A1H3TTW4_9BURK|nr:hypothetical protein [Delftia lacustris]SDZ53145.1 hypothetical protein SAMN05421547_13228 [Delftia lacustris]